ncbi:hypothetical protein R3P38DRAFT_2806673 [Favolaschia claudopus]|uniref:Uncharacterized protein n=1 Tax=Favolaschia claudopus TaxID=2862362 RepID=A0AAV9ZIY6_9AGAR
MLWSTTGIRNHFSANSHCLKTHSHRYQNGLVIRPQRLLNPLDQRGYSEVQRGVVPLPCVQSMTLYNVSPLLMDIPSCYPKPNTTPKQKLVQYRSMNCLLETLGLSNTNPKVPQELQASIYTKLSYNVVLRACNWSGQTFINKTRLYSAVKLFTERSWKGNPPGREKRLGGNMGVAEKWENTEAKIRIQGQEKGEWVVMNSGRPDHQQINRTVTALGLWKVNSSKSLFGSSSDLGSDRTAPPMVNRPISWVHLTHITHSHSEHIIRRRSKSSIHGFRVTRASNILSQDLDTSPGMRRHRSNLGTQRCGLLSPPQLPSK